jgi:WD40 repeat protein
MINQVEISRDGTFVVSASDDFTVRIWDQSGNILHLLEGHTGWVNSAIISQDGSRVISGADDRTARI